MRIIDADELEKTMYATADLSCAESIHVDVIADIIGNAPTVDAVPVRHGHWVSWYEEVYDSFGIGYAPHCKCSECGREYDPYIANRTNYCSNCGVKLDGKDGDHAEGTVQKERT